MLIAVLYAAVPWWIVNILHLSQLHRRLCSDQAQLWWLNINVKHLCHLVTDLINGPFEAGVFRWASSLASPLKVVQLLGQKGAHTSLKEKVTAQAVWLRFWNHSLHQQWNQIKSCSWKRVILHSFDTIQVPHAHKLIVYSYKLKAVHLLIRQTTSTFTEAGI